MRATLVNEDDSFVAEVDAPDGIKHIRYGERIFHAPRAEPTRFKAVDVYAAPIEGSSVEPTP